jgi:hypothetical protein
MIGSTKKAVIGGKFMAVEPRYQNQAIQALFERKKTAGLTCSVCPAVLDAET